ncbi:MAG: solute carrier family 23 protein [Castellaniella sp.]
MGTARLLRLPATPPFRRPAELAYASDELPPPPALAGLAAQQGITALAFIAYALVMARIGGLDAADTQALVTASIIAMATATILQSWGGRLGAGVLLVSIPSPIIVVTAGLILSRHGVAGIASACVIHGVVALCSGYLVPRLRTVLTPGVAGIVVCVSGLALVEPSLMQITRIDDQGGLDTAGLSSALAALATIVSLSIWGRQRGKLYALIAGLLVGMAVALALGQFQVTESLSAMPLAALPELPGFSLHLDAGEILAVAMLSLMSQLDSFGCAVLMHKMNDAGWRRPNMRIVSGSMRANGLADLAGALFGAAPVSNSSANIALCHISRSTARIIGLFTGVLLLVCAFLPKVTLALTFIPAPILGAVGLYAAAYLIVSGIELIASRAMDARGIFTVGLAFIAGTGIMTLPQLTLALPEWLRFAAASPIVLAGSVGIILNLVFRVGSTRHARQSMQNVAPASTAGMIIDFVEQHGAAWNARRNVITRAASACLEAAEALQASTPPRSLLEIRGSFDEYNLDIELRHDGPPLVLDARARPLPENLLEMDDEESAALLDQALGRVSSVLLHNLADRLNSGQNDEASWLRLHFDH